MTEKIKTSATTTHLPFKALIAQLVQTYAPLQIYQFAKLTKKAQVNSVFNTAHLQKQRTYYLLMVTESDEIVESKVQHFVDGAYTGAKVIVQVRAKSILLQCLNHRNAYLATITNLGKRCYCAPGLEEIPALLQPNLKKHLGKIIINWRKRSEMASGFLVAAQQAIEVKQERACLFLLHEAAKQVCKGLVFVFMGNQPDDESLERLLYLCACFSELPQECFLGTPQSRLLFNILVKYATWPRVEEAFDLQGMSIYQFTEFIEEFLRVARILYQERLLSTSS